MSIRSEPLGLLYRDHRDWLQHWLSGRVGCREVAADLTQDTFARLLSGSAPDSLHEPRAFLTTVAKGLAANWWRRQSLERAYLDYLAAQPERTLPSSEALLIIRDALERIDAMLDQMPDPVRQVFLLARFDGMEYPDIALRLGLSLSTVKRHMKRAIVGCLIHAG